MLRSVKALLICAEKSGLPVWKAVQRLDCEEQGYSEEESLSKMRGMLYAMREADSYYDKNDRSLSGLSGGDGGKMHQRLMSGETICGPLFGRIIEAAIKMGECNACMKRIVAAPTAGSCGVLPAVLLPLSEQFDIPEEKLLEAMYVAAGMGEIIAARASISGAQGGCQAEIGSASAMAAAAAAHLFGGTDSMIANAAALALKSLLGLVCDPVGGLVEVPCVKRNVVGAVNAVSSAEMALAGIESRIPPDEVIDAMAEIGDTMPAAMRETGEGGLAATPEGKKYRPAAK